MFLICSKCHQIPLIEFNDYSKILMICQCRQIIIEQNLIEETLSKRLNLKCKCCKSQIENVNVYEKEFYCDKCVENKINYMKIEYDYIIKNCIKHGKEYKYYLKELKCNICEDCEKFDSVNFSELKTSIPIIENIPNYEKSDFQNYDFLFMKIIKTFEYIKSKGIFNFNAIMNYYNTLEFIKFFYLDNIVCQKCFYPYKINFIDENFINVSCKCETAVSKTIKDFINHIKLVECNDCHINFLQKEIYFDFLSNHLLCKNCLNERFDYIKFNQISFICNLHCQIFKYYCKKCNQHLCEKCKYIHPHIATKINFHIDFSLLKEKITNLNNNDLNEVKILLKLNYEKMKKYNSFQINIIQNYGSIFENYNNS